MQAKAVALGCSPELEGKTTRLKTTYTLDTGLERIKLGLTWKLLSENHLSLYLEVLWKLPREQSNL